MAYSVSLQTRDIGIRIALGPEPRGVLRMVLMKEAPLARLSSLDTRF
ncbi:MAG TPA: hypothetical protein VG538_16400 [Vicinamibacterales bacterium]|nr:hypothetical protein [Vicinamibacterales bacterium]